MEDFDWQFLLEYIDRRGTRSHWLAPWPQVRLVHARGDRGPQSDGQSLAQSEGSRLRRHLRTRRQGNGLAGPVHPRRQRQVGESPLEIHLNKNGRVTIDLLKESRPPLHFKAQQFCIVSSNSAALHLLPRKTIFKYISAVFYLSFGILSVVIVSWGERSRVIFFILFKKLFDRFFMVGLGGLLLKRRVIDRVSFNLKDIRIPFSQDLKLSSRPSNFKYCLVALLRRNRTTQLTA